MIVLSLFDGISCGQIAFERLGITFDGKNNIYLASEIKNFAIDTTQLHYPNTIQVGDVCKLHFDKATNALYSNCERHDNKYYQLFLTFPRTQILINIYIIFPIPISLKESLVRVAITTSYTIFICAFVRHTN